MKNKLTDKDIEMIDKTLNRCSDIQLCILIERFNDELYKRLTKPIVVPYAKIPKEHKKGLRRLRRWKYTGKILRIMNQ